MTTRERLRRWWERTIVGNDEWARLQAQQRARDALRRAAERAGRGA